MVILLEVPLKFRFQNLEVRRKVQIIPEFVFQSYIRDAWAQDYLKYISEINGEQMLNIHDDQR